MLTDWLLLRRAGRELETELGGGRVVDAGLLDDGRAALRIGGRRDRQEATLALDLFGSPPLVTLESAELALGPDPGSLRAIAVALRGLRLSAVRHRDGDRLLGLDFGTTSRFGVSRGLELVLELVPRFGNAVLLRDRTVVAAVKQFDPADNQARSITVGGRYEPPPLPRQTLDDGAFVDVAGADPEAARRALGRVRPRLPRLLAEAVVAHRSADGWPLDRSAAAELLAAADALLAAAEAAAAARDPLYVYRAADGTLLAAHLVPLAQYTGLDPVRATSLLELFASARGETGARRSGDATARRRGALQRRIGERLATIAAELAALDSRERDASGRDALRAAGDALHTYAPMVPVGAERYRTPTEPPLIVELDPDLDAKANAARYFARYRKASDALPHLRRRAEALRAKQASFEELAFEADRADASTLIEVAAELDTLEGRRAPAAPSPPRKSAAPLRIDRPSGARIFVGRSPRENVDVTFRIAKPDDLWFHARGVPGSHVVLQAAGRPVADEDLDFAADLAARHSRGRSSPRVEVDFTERKYVRKRRDAAPGLVWYTNARTRVGRTDSAGGD